MRATLIAVIVASLLASSGCSFATSYSPLRKDGCSMAPAVVDTLFTGMLIGGVVAESIAMNRAGDSWSSVGPGLALVATVPFLIGYGLSAIRGYTEGAVCRSKLPRPTAQ
jgi:hypothetical protein